MPHRDIRMVIFILYVLTVLFMGFMYFQESLMTEPGALVTLQNANPELSQSGTQSIYTFTAFSINWDSALIVVISVTLFFGFALRMTRSRSY